MRYPALFCIFSFVCFLLTAQVSLGNEKADLQNIKLKLREKEQLQSSQQATLADLQATLKNLRKQSAAQAQQNVAIENQLLALETQEQTLLRQQQQTQQEFEDTAAKLQQTLKTLQRIGRQPTVALLFKGDTPLDTVRSGSLLASLLQKFNAQTTVVKLQLNKLTLLQQQLTATKNDLSAQQEDLQKQRAKLAEITAQKNALNQRLTKTALLTSQEINKLKQRSNSLEQLIANLEADAAKKAKEQHSQKSTRSQRTVNRDDSAQAPLQKGRFLWPAAGRITVRFGQTNAFGTKNKGIVIQTRKQGVVVSPATGNVIFAGSFRGNSKVVIIKHHSPYHSVIMGMASLDIKTGDAVEAGEPIGKMGKQVLDLYLELRRNGEQVNPSPWLAAKENS
jgi:septal ring factor EnvC (AmiA/AmiB activator)